MNILIGNPSSNLNANANPNPNTNPCPSSSPNPNPNLKFYTSKLVNYTIYLLTLTNTDRHTREIKAVERRAQDRVEELEAEQVQMIKEVAQKAQKEILKAREVARQADLKGDSSANSTAAAAAVSAAATSDDDGDEAHGWKTSDSSDSGSGDGATGIYSSYSGTGADCGEDLRSATVEQYALRHRAEDAEEAEEAAELLRKRLAQQEEVHRCELEELRRQLTMASPRHDLDVAPSPPPNAGDHCGDAGGENTDGGDDTGSAYVTGDQSNLTLSTTVQIAHSKPAKSRGCSLM